jgi:chromosome segregation ATPase
MTVIDRTFDQVFEELRAERAGFSAEMRAERAGMRAEWAELRAEMRTERAELRAEMRALRDRLDRLDERLGRIGFRVAGILATAFIALVATQL